MTEDDLRDLLPSVQLRFESSCEVGDLPEDRAIQHWMVTAVLPQDEDRARKEIVGHFHFAKLDPYAGEDLLDIAGGHQDLEIPASAVLDVETQHVCEDIYDSVGRYVLIGVSARLEPKWRGFGFGRLLVALALERLMNDATIVAFQPTPLGGVDWPVERREAAVSKLTEIWASIGFEPYKDGVMVMRPALVAFSEALAKLREHYDLD